MRKKVLFISSTGGHLNELLQLSPLFEKYDSYIITEKDKANENLKQSNENNNWEMIGKDMGKLQELINKLEVLVEEESKNEVQDANELIENNIINEINEAVE